MSEWAASLWLYIEREDVGAGSVFVDRDFLQSTRGNVEFIYSIKKGYIPSPPCVMDEGVAPGKLYMQGWQRIVGEGWIGLN